MSPPLLQADDITVRFPPMVALDSVDVLLAHRETLGIVGAAHAGKSTLLLTLLGGVREATGAIEFDGHVPEKWGVRETYGHGIAYVPQHDLLFKSLSVEENLMVIRRQLHGHTRWTLDSVYEMLPMLREVRHIPTALLTIELKRYTAIARGLMINPSVLLLDSPATGLTSAQQSALLGVLHQLRHEKLAIIVAEQSIAFVRKVADRLLCLCQGRVVFSAPNDDTLDEAALEQAYAGLVEPSAPLETKPPAP